MMTIAVTTVFVVSWCLFDKLRCPSPQGCALSLVFCPFSWACFGNPLHASMITFTGELNHFLAGVGAAHLGVLCVDRVLRGTTPVIMSELLAIYGFVP